MRQPLGEGAGARAYGDRRAKQIRVARRARAVLGKPGPEALNAQID
jgi:hypothetical protein